MQSLQFEENLNISGMVSPEKEPPGSFSFDTTRATAALQVLVPSGTGSGARGIGSERERFRCRHRSERSIRTSRTEGKEV